MRQATTLVAGLFVLLLSGCNSDPQSTTTVSPSAPAADRYTYQDAVREIDSTLERCTVVHRSIHFGVGNTNFDAYFSDGEVVHIHETQNAGDFGSSESRYYYRDGTLLFFQQHKTMVFAEENGTRTKASVLSWLVFDSTETVIYAEKEVDGSFRAPEQAEFDDVIAHSRSLVEKVTS